MGSFSSSMVLISIPVVFVLACGDVFLYGGVFTIEMFSHTIVDKTHSAPDVVLVVVVTCDLVKRIS